MLQINKLKLKLNQNKPVIGTWNTLGSPLVTEVIAQAGFDFQIIDLEHGPFQLDKLHLHVTACENTSKCTPLVRIPSNNDWMVLQALDQGAHGIVVPHIDSADAAKKLIEYSKYYPNGNRGFTPFSKAAGFTNVDTSRYVKRANDETLNVVIIESLQGLESLDEIIEVKGIDVIYFGAYDLSQALGHPGEVRHEKVISTIKDAVDKVNRYGKYSGGFVPQNTDDIEWLLDMGMNFITYEVDSSMLYKKVRDIANWFETKAL